ncbi:hypothetical protein, partial [Paraburkholderia humisilvae]|uniref:hypothetical protein n=1 Tax=Paraburkholderia humisilvae TaxID=627669 RepID=UPI0035E68FD6
GFPDASFQLRVSGMSGRTGYSRPARTIVGKPAKCFDPGVGNVFFIIHLPHCGPGGIAGQ